MKLMTILTTVLFLTLTSCAHKACKKSCDIKGKKDCKKSCELKKKDKKKSMACCAKKS